MRRDRQSIIHLAGLLLLLANAAPGAEAQGDAVFPAPRRVTAETRGDPHALASLQQAGQIFFEDDFESDASLKNYFEIRGLKEGNAKRTSDAKLAHTGTGAMQFTAVARDGKESGSGATGWFGPKGYDRVYLRLYIKFAADYQGIRWRTSPDVRLKRFDLGVYVHAAAKDNIVWFDDVPLSTGYIGPKGKAGD
ncbi:MAG: hypothetical protein NTW21_09065 [Verrucomicrobia bacterium]|nr:hypothetical protein [Verrucomicrobiota bacterium]